MIKIVIKYERYDGWNPFQTLVNTELSKLEHRKDLTRPCH